MILLITIIPSVLIFIYFLYSDKFKEPKRIIIITFLFGVLITVPAGYLNKRSYLFGSSFAIFYQLVYVKGFSKII